MKHVNQDKLRNAVRDRYIKIISADKGPESPAGACCDKSGDVSKEQISEILGYMASELSEIPAEANLGLGCGNPVFEAKIQQGETVLDLGSGGGIDCFLASRHAGAEGRVIGVDMTPEMLSRARESAQANGFENVEFRLGEIEYLPIADNTVDVIISNCVINLSPDKQKVFSDCFRVLKSGGRITVSDIVAKSELPEDIKDDIALYAGCIAGASLISDVEQMLADAGFKDISIRPKDNSGELVSKWSRDKNPEDYVVSAIIYAVKP